MGRITADGTKIYYNTRDRYGCWDTVTDANCGGNEPQTIAVANQHPPFPVRNASGTLLGYCTYRTALCVDDTNTVFTMPSGLLSFVTGTTLPLWNYDGAGQWAEADNRLYLNKGPSSSATSNVYCHDFDTNAACAGFAGTNVGTRIYTIHKDPSIENCMWTNGDAGQITTFNATTGVPGCASGTPSVELPYTAVVPRMSCQEIGRVVQWENISFDTPAGISNTDLRVTVIDTDGNPVTGWIDRIPSSSGVLNMAGLSVAETGTRPTIRVEAGDVEGSLLDDLIADVKFRADAPELCLTLEAVPLCENFTPGVGDLSVPNGLIQAATITTPTSGSPIGSDTQVTLTGTNTGDLCSSTISLLQTPNREYQAELANTGGNYTPMLIISLLALITGGVFVHYSSRKEQG
jgi:hypothetical protein